MTPPLDVIIAGVIMQAYRHRAGMEGMMVYIERQSDEVVSGPTHYIDVARSTDQSFRADQLPRSRVRRTPCFGWTPARLWAGVYYLLDEVTE